MAKEVKIRITAKDATARAFGSVKTNLRQMGGLAVRATRRIGSAFRALGRGVRNAAVGISAGLIALGVSSVKAAAQAEQTRSKFRAVFKETADDARKWAVSFGKSVNRATIDIQFMLSKVQDLFVPLGFSRKEAAAFSKTVATLAVDIASFNENVGDDEALNAIQSALVGNSETVRRFGVILTEANIAQEAVALGMAKTTKEVSNQAKVMARLSLIQKGTTDAQGDAARTADQLTNVFKGLSAAFKTFKIEVGEQLIQGFGLGRSFSDLTKRLGAFTAKLRQTGALREFAEKAVSALKPVKELMTDLFSGGEKRLTAIEKIKTAGVEFGGSVVNILIGAAEEFGAKIAIGMAKAPLRLGTGLGAIRAEAAKQRGRADLERAVAETSNVGIAKTIAIGSSPVTVIANGLRLLSEKMSANTEEIKGLKEQESG